MQDSSYMLTNYLLVHHIYKSALIIVGFPTFVSFHKYLVDNDNSTIIYLKKHAFGSCSSKYAVFIQSSSRQAHPVYCFS